MKARLSAEDALKHPWIAGDGAAEDKLEIAALKRFHYRHKLIKILVNAVLTELSEEDQDLLQNGLLNLNREVEVMNDEQVLEWLLLHCPIEEQEGFNDEWRQKRMHEVRLYDENSGKRTNTQRTASTQEAMSPISPWFFDADYDWVCCTECAAVCVLSWDVIM